jgi:hypothetical protein
VIDHLVDPASRAQALSTLYSRVRFAECCAISGLNDSGKTALLTLAQLPNVLRRFGPGELRERSLFVHVDCNLLAGASERDLYAVMAETTLLAARRAGKDAAAERGATVLGRAELHADSPVLAAVALESLLAHLAEAEDLALIYLFDEFDGLYRRIEPRAALALRAFRNRLGPALAYVLALDVPLGRIRSGQAGDTAEFEELFVGGASVLQMLALEDAEAFVHRYVESRVGTGPEWLAGLLARLTGGHPGLLWAACAAWHRLNTVDRIRFEAQLPESDEVVAECQNVWLRLPTQERDAVLALRSGSTGDLALIEDLRERGLLGASPDGRIIIPLLEQYVASLSGASRAGLAFDPQTGEVTVDGVRRSSQLGPTEFRLLQVLAQHPGAIVTKDEVARSVWPREERLNGIDDARIDKLVDRVRSKIEPDPKAPRFLVTVRGLGYRLLPNGTGT